MPAQQELSPFMAEFQQAVAYAEQDNPSDLIIVEGRLMATELMPDDELSMSIDKKLYEFGALNVITDGFNGAIRRRWPEFPHQVQLDCGALAVDGSQHSAQHLLVYALGFSPVRHVPTIGIVLPVGRREYGQSGWVEPMIENRDLISVVNSLVSWRQKVAHTSVS